MKKSVWVFIALLGLGSTVLAADDGATLFKKCSVCHGATGEKAALGKSKVIKEMTKGEITTALKGYKDGSYGGASKGLMKGQVAALTEAQMTVLANHIGK